MTSYLSRKMGEVLELKTKLGAIGIELELEGKLPSEGPFQWVVKPEGSLRDENGVPGGGYEYVMRTPLSGGALDEAIDSLLTHLKDSKYKPLATIRCSTHFHVNVQALTVRQTYNALGLYSLVEGLLVRRNGPNRMGNLFCLRTTDADALLADILGSIDTRLFFNMFGINSHKYGSVNLEATRRFGSLEFRFCRAFLEPEEMKMWAGIFQSLVFNGATASLKDMLDKAQGLSVKAFLLNYFTGPQVEYILTDIPTVEASEMLVENIDFVEALELALDNADNENFWHVSFREGGDYLKALAFTITGGNPKPIKKTANVFNTDPPPAWASIAETWTTLTDGLSP